MRIIDELAEVILTECCLTCSCFNGSEVKITELYVETFHETQNLLDLGSKTIAVEL